MFDVIMNVAESCIGVLTDLIRTVEYPVMSPPPGDGALSGPPSWRLYRSGPWLVIYGSGPDSEDTATQVREQCLARGIDAVLCPVDEIRQVRLDRFAGLVVVLPSQLSWYCPRS